eukprot:46970-Amorphochlora_amoeboformis.AAC.2
MPGDVVESLAGQLNNHSGCSVDPEGMVKAPKKFPTILVLPGFGNAQVFTQHMSSEGPRNP